MIEREKIIRAVDSCFDYWLEQHRCLLPLELENVRQLKADALALLKEQEAVEPIEIIDEKYPVGDHNRYKGYRCGNCKEDIPWDANYCLYCGRKVNWDD